MMAAFGICLVWGHLCFKTHLVIPWNDSSKIQKYGLLNLNGFEKKILHREYMICPSNSLSFPVKTLFYRVFILVNKMFVSQGV
jgi:hypothetical protein